VTSSTQLPVNCDLIENDTGLDAVTGAFSYSGSAIAQHLLAAQRSVRTLTSHSTAATNDSPIDIHQLDFDQPIELVKSLEGVTTLYNTYWVRFARGTLDHSLAIENSRTLFQAARQAGVQRIVHVSITHPSSASPLPYFRGKALVERALAESGVSYAILRPAILFGGEGVLINNIAWLLRTLPVFAVGGRGDYRIRGIHIDDLAQLAIRQGGERTNSVTDAVGPEQPTFLELVNLIKSAVNSRSVVLHVPGWSLPTLSRIVGTLLGDVLLTRDEYAAMSNGLAASNSPSTGTTQISQWIVENADSIGRSYANELKRHYTR
jgi:uncharacterized protein YbjT (DUF2867 family)